MAGLDRDRLMPRSSLLTLHGWGHTSLFLSQCADAALLFFAQSDTEQKVRGDARTSS